MAVHVLVGAALGAVLGAGASALTQALRGERLDWRSIGAAALGGAAAGGIAALTCGAGLLAGSVAARTGGVVVAGATGGLGEQVAHNALRGREWSRGAARAAVRGAVFGAAGAAARLAAAPLAAAARRAPDLARQAPTAARQVGGAMKQAGRAARRSPRVVWERYRAALVTRPRWTQAATSGGLTATGDVLAQASEGKGFDWKRTAYRTAWASAWAGTIGWAWTAKLDRWMPARTWRNTLIKVGLDQLLMNPASSVPYFAGYGMLVEGETPGEAWRRVVNTVPRTTLLSLQVWPVVHAIKFRWVPVELQPVFSKLLGLVWNVAFSRVAFAEEEEKEEEEAQPAPATEPARPEGKGLVAAMAEKNKQ